MSDHERSKRKLKAVQVCAGDGYDEYYEVGKSGVTSIEWGQTNGEMAMLQTVLVCKDGQPHSEHRFSNVLGVYYVKDEEP